MNNRFLGTLVLATCVVLGGGLPVSGQSVEETPSRWRLGPVGLSPSIALTNVGVDTNVFNETVEPKQDFTATLTPSVAASLRMQRVMTTARQGLSLVYFQQYASQRSVDTSTSVRVSVRSNHLTPWVSAGYQIARQRVGYEIDLRSRRTTSDFALGVETRLTPKTQVQVSGSSTSYGYESALFLGSDLKEALSRRTETAAAEYRQALTVLTTFVGHVELSRERFEALTERNANRSRTTVGLELNTRALIAGVAHVGVATFASESGTLPGFTGLVADVGVSATALGRLRLGFDGQRDLSYSYDRIYPYYVETGGTFRATPQLTPKWDVEARLGAHRLVYRSLLTDAGIPQRRDNQTILGLGIGYRLAPQMRMAFNLDRDERVSLVSGHDYSGYKAGMSVTYGR